MEENVVCSCCGGTFPKDQLTFFDDNYFCGECLFTETEVCSHCGTRIYSGDNEGSREQPLCRSCFDAHYTNCNSYLITVSNGRDQNYKQILETRTFRPDPSWSESRCQKEAKKFAAEFEAQVKNGHLYKGDRMFFSDFAEKWFAEYVQASLALNTQLKYRDALNNHILPHLGRYKIADLTPIRLQEFFNSYYKDGVPIYKPATIQKIYTILRSIFKKAFQWQVIAENTMNRIYLPRTQATAAESSKCFNQEEALRFLKFLDEPYTITVPAHKSMNQNGTETQISEYQRIEFLSLQLKVFFFLLIFGGFRKGEALALTWDDINFEQCEINISKSVVNFHGELIVKEPKTKGSIRTVVMPEKVMVLLGEHRTAQIEEAARLTGYWQDHSLLFTRDNGTMMGYSTPYQSFKEIIKRYNASHPNEPLPNISLHGLRHTCATLLLANNADLVTVAARLGHSNSSTTLNTYAHALKNGDRTASKILESKLN